MSATEPTLESIVSALRHPDAYAHVVCQVEVIETHISFVLLAGAFAYKLKKPVNLGFLDFSTLARRQHCCEEEIRINRRLAPGIYLDVVAVRRQGSHIRLHGPGDILEYAVRMRRFPHHAVLSETPLECTILDRLAMQIATFHQNLPAAPAETAYGEPARVLDPMLANVRVLRDSPISAANLARVERIAAWTQSRFDALESLLGARQREGWIRECHGDLHLGNIALVDGEPLIFDAIEFNPELRWIDCISDIGFLAMDLRQQEARTLERRLINSYLELTGDYAGLRLLSFYQVYRAMVRAKVSGIRLAQHPGDAAICARICTELDHYLRLAEDYTQVHPQRVFITHGLSGSGKTWLGHALRERLALIQIRSDVERKRLFGITENAAAAPPAELYSPRASERTYQRLYQLAEQVLRAGCSVLVDAACLRARQRALFGDLAARHGCPFTILSLTASPEVLKARVSARCDRGDDASDANAATVIRQQGEQEPLSAAEQAQAIQVNTQSPAEIAALLQRLSQEDSAGSDTSSVD
jgi:aminoglycoside phosphotransferase family enzyme